MKRNVCVACNFIKSGVKTRKAIPHTCGKSTEDIMKIIKEGKSKPKDQPIQRTCMTCNCIFEYVKSDIHNDFREGSYVICPNGDCNSIIAV